MTTLGYLLVHLLAETAHHAGHADIVREAIDGRAGGDHDEFGDEETLERLRGADPGGGRRAPNPVVRSRPVVEERAKRASRNRRSVARPMRAPVTDDYGHSRELETASARRGHRGRVRGDDGGRGGVQPQGRPRRSSTSSSPGSRWRPWPGDVGPAGGRRPRGRRQPRGQPQGTSPRCSRWCSSASPSAPRPRPPRSYLGLGLVLVPFLVVVGHRELRAQRPRGGAGVLRRAVGRRRAAARPDRQRRRGGRAGRAARARAGARGGPGRRRGAHPDRPRAARHRVPLDQRGDHPDPGRTPPARPRPRAPRRPTSPRSRRPPARPWRRCAGSSACCAPRARSAVARAPARPRRARPAGAPGRLGRPAGAAPRSRASRSPLSPGVDLAAYRIAQEGLTNAVRHAGATEAQVLVRYAPAPAGHRGRGQRARACVGRTAERRARPGRHPRAGRAVRRDVDLVPSPTGGVRLAVSLPLRGGADMTHPAGDRRRPGHGAGRLPLAARRRARLRGGRRGRPTARRPSRSSRGCSRT